MLDRMETEANLSSSGKRDRAHDYYGNPSNKVLRGENLLEDIELEYMNQVEGAKQDQSTPSFPVSFIQQTMAREIIESEFEVYNEIKTAYNEFNDDLMSILNEDETEVAMEVSTGGNGTECSDKMIRSLEYYVPDTLHDFGKERNGIFPSDFSADNFLQLAKKFLKENDTGNDDITKKYCEHWPGQFEEEVKLDYLLGKLCPPIKSDIFYFFSQSPPWTYNDRDPRQGYFERNPYGTIPEFFAKIKDDYKHYIFDAVMAMHKEEEWENKMSEFKLLVCNLWDPAGSGIIHKPNDITATNQALTTLGLTLQTTQAAKDGFTIINTLFSVNGISKNFDDEVYGKLFEKCLPEIPIKLRYATNKPLEGGLFSVGSEVRVAILINDQIFLTDGGYPVKELSEGMSYIENGYPSRFNINLGLKAIIDYVKTLLSQDKAKFYLYTLLSRFKSTGDHGSAMTTKIINEQIGIPTLYLSGDQLAYIYSILNNIPTIFKYYSAKKEVDESGEKTRVHFVGAYLPETNPIRGVIREYNEIVKYLNSSTRVTNAEGVADMTDDVLRDRIAYTKTGLFNDFVEHIKNLSGKPSGSTKTNEQIDSDITAVYKQIFKHVTTKITQLSQSSGEFTEDMLNGERDLIYYIKKMIDKTIYILNFDVIQAIKQETTDAVKSNLSLLLNKNHPSMFSRFKTGLKAAFTSRRAVKVSYFSEALKSLYGKSKEYASKLAGTTEAAPAINAIKTRISTAKEKFKKRITDLFGNTALTEDLVLKNDESIDKSIDSILTDTENPANKGLSEYLKSALTVVQTAGNRRTKKRRVTKRKTAKRTKKTAKRRGPKR